MKITEITPAQAGRFPEWRDRWVAAGLSVEPADFARAEAAARRAYALCGLPPPRVVLRLGSPLAAVIGGPLALSILGKRNQVGSQVVSQVGSQVRSQV